MLNSEPQHHNQSGAAEYIPFMVNAQAGQASDGVSLQQLVQADRTFPRVLRQDVLWKTNAQHKP